MRPSLACLLCALPWSLMPVAQVTAQTARPAHGPEILAVTYPGASSLPRPLLESTAALPATHCSSKLLALPCLFGLGEKHHFLDDSAAVQVAAARLADLYRRWGYPDVAVSGEVVPRGAGVEVRFRVDEGSPVLVQRVRIEGLDAFTPALQRPQRLPLEVGGPYAVPLLDATERILRGRAAERGFPYATVEVSGDVDEAAHRVEVVLVLQPGPRARFGAIRVRAGAPIAAALVRRGAAYQPGQSYQPARLRETVNRLSQLPIVAEARIATPGLAVGDTVLETVLQVRPRQVQGFGMEGTLSSSACGQLSGGWQHRYFLGGARVLSLTGAVSNLFATEAGGNFPCSATGGGAYAQLDHAVRVEFLQPWLGSPSNSIRLRFFEHRESAPNVYVERGYGGAVQWIRETTRGTYLSAAYEARRERLEAAGIYFCANVGVCSEGAIAAASESRWLAPITLSLARISAVPPGSVRRPPPLEMVGDFPSVWRYRARLDVAMAGRATGSSYRYARPLLEGSVTRLLGRTVELAGRLELGALEGATALPPQVRLYGGGVNSVRGLPQNMLGPTVLVARDTMSACPGVETCAPGQTVDPNRVDARPTGGDRLIELNAEARWWLTDHLQLAAFVDYGWLGRSTAPSLPGGAVTERAASVATPGLGIRYDSPAGPIRLDLGVDPRGPRRLPLLEQTSNGAVRFIENVVYDPFASGNPGWVRELYRRLQVQLSVGEAF